MSSECNEQHPLSAHQSGFLNQLTNNLTTTAPRRNRLARKCDKAVGWASRAGELNDDEYKGGLESILHEACRIVNAYLATRTQQHTLSSYRMSASYPGVLSSHHRSTRLPPMAAARNPWSLVPHQVDSPPNDVDGRGK